MRRNELESEKPDFMKGREKIEKIGEEDKEDDDTEASYKKVASIRLKVGVEMVRQNGGTIKLISFFSFYLFLHTNLFYIYIYIYIYMCVCVCVCGFYFYEWCVFNIIDIIYIYIYICIYIKIGNYRNRFKSDGSDDHVGEKLMVTSLK